MTIESAFLAEILADPDDRAPALIYADWLDDQGRWQEALFHRFCAQSGLLPLRSRQGGLGWWDDVMGRFMGRLVVGKTWLVECWSWTPTNQTLPVDAGH